MRFTALFSILIFALFLIAFPTLAQIPLNWTIDEINPGTDVTVSPDGLKFSEGTKSCHLQLNSGAVPYMISDLFPVTGNTPYEFSIDVFDYDTAGQIKVYADFYDAYGFDIFGAPPVFSADSNQWMTIHWEDTIPPQAIMGYILIKYYCQPSLYNFTRKADAWVDNVQFRQAGGDNLVANGSFEQWVVGINEDKPDNQTVKIYPNPAKDFVNVELVEMAEWILISDLTGREVMKINVTNQHSMRLDLSGLGNGFYNLSISRHGKPLQVTKVVISRR
jgi:hypothetical protein